MNELLAILNIDGYKVDHISQYPKGTTLVYSNLTARSDKILSDLGMTKVKGVVCYGVQYFCKKFLKELFNDNFFNLPKEEVMHEYKEFMDFYLGKDKVEIKHIENLHSLGYLPIKIKAFKEGSVVPFGVPILTIENTLDDFFWLTNALETAMSAIMWKMIINATVANELRRLGNKYAILTCDNNLHLPYQFHDFSARGMSGLEDMLIAGSCHLLSFKGTDTLPAIKFLENYYGANRKTDNIGCSVPASEHSVMCAGGQDTEIATYRRLINEVYPTGIVSLVSDTWDYWNLLTNTLPQLKTDIMARDGKLVCRPDSGNPVDIICGISSVTNKDSSPQEKGSIELLWEIFGGTINDKGYKVLDNHIGLIYGDSITYLRAKEIFEKLMLKGFAASNIVFGIGAFTYQYTTRDVAGLAVKGTFAKINGESVMLQKAPKTDSTKKSHRGKIIVYKDENGIISYKDGLDSDYGTILETVFEDGILKYETNLNEIRAELEKDI